MKSTIRSRVACAERCVYADKVRDGVTGVVGRAAGRLQTYRRACGDWGGSAYVERRERTAWPFSGWAVWDAAQHVRG